MAMRSSFEIVEKIVGKRKDNLLYFDFSIPADQRLVGACVTSRSAYKFNRISFSIDLPLTGLTKLSECSWDLWLMMKEWGAIKTHPLVFDFFETIYWQVCRDNTNYRTCTTKEIRDFVNGMLDRPRRIEIEDPSEDFDLWVTYVIG
jgi:hypothetical protein